MAHQCQTGNPTRSIRSLASRYIGEAFAIPFNAVRATNKNGTWYLTMNATKDGLKAAPGYKYDKVKSNWVPA
jgi:hypothetical protein